mmetsp:Transcript_3604/g.8004  ORF Transcript_3604/g.8004 Transcript_3604/m.8004 type:complete len:209 (-) Transcript_3604:408-1034(-)
MTNEDEITLIMKRSHLPALKLGIVRKQRSQEPSSTMTQPRRKPIQHQFRHVIRSRSIVGYIRGRNDIAHFEESRGPSKSISSSRRTQMRNEHAIAHLALLRKYNQMSELAIASKGTNLLDGVRLSWIVVQLRKEPHQVRNEMEQFSRWTRTSRQQNLGTDLIRKVRSKLIFCLVGNNLLIVRLYSSHLRLTCIIKCTRSLFLHLGIFA